MGYCLIHDFDFPGFECPKCWIEKNENYNSLGKRRRKIKQDINETIDRLDSYERRRKEKNGTNLDMDR